MPVPQRDGEPSPPASVTCTGFEGCWEPCTLGVRRLLSL